MDSDKILVMYRIKLIVAQYKQRYPGEYMPNVVDAWDEYVCEDNYAGFEEALRKHEAMVGSDYEWVRILEVQVPSEIVETLADPPSVNAEVVE